MYVYEGVSRWDYNWNCGLSKVDGPPNVDEPHPLCWGLNRTKRLSKREVTVSACPQAGTSSRLLLLDWNGAGMDSSGLRTPSETTPLASPGLHPAGLQILEYMYIHTQPPTHIYVYLGIYTCMSSLYIYTHICQYRNKYRYRYFLLVLFLWRDNGHSPAF